MRQRLSLTMRLTILFSLSSAVVLLGLGLLIWLTMDHHFANEDYVVLGDNIRLIQKIAGEQPVEGLPIRLTEVVEHHPRIRGASPERSGTGCVCDCWLRLQYGVGGARPAAAR